MPWHLQQSGSNYFVVDDKGKKFSEKPLPKWRAKKQLAALYASEPGVKGGPGSGPRPRGGKSPKGSSKRTEELRAELAKLNKQLSSLRKLRRSTRYISGTSDFKAITDADIEKMSLDELEKAIAEVEMELAQSEETNKAALLKDGAPASSFLVVEDPQKVTTWHLQVRDAQGKPDRRLMGAAHAALLSPGGHRGEKYQGPNKGEAIAKLRKLYEAEGMKFNEKSFHVFKQADGSWRWVTISSSAFRDRDGEIITEKALADDVARCDEQKNYGPLRWWHVGGWEAPDGLENWQTWKATPGVDLGTCDFNMLHGKILIESGTFKDAVTGEAFSTAQDNLEVSIGFSHPPDEPGEGKQYKNIHRFERSLLPAGMASNLLTKLIVTKGETMKASEKLQALLAIIKGKPELAKQILEDAEQVQKAAEEAGLEFKEVTEMIAEPVAETETTTEEVIQSPAAEMAAPEVTTPIDEKAAPPPPAPAEPVEIGDWTPEQLQKFIMDVMKAGMEKKEVDLSSAVEAVHQGIKDVTSETLTLKDNVAAMMKLLEDQQKALDELTDARPVGIKQMQARRPTEQTANVKSVAPVGPHIDESFLKFLQGGN